MAKGIKTPEIVGARFCFLIAIENMGYTKKDGIIYKCRCDCGKIIYVSKNRLRTYQRKSCGCKNRNATHRKTNSRLHNIWTGMKGRCHNPNNHKYSRYGGRGIKVCSEWQDFAIFMDWAMKNGYKDNLTIDRIDVNGDYCPENCQFLTLSENSIKAWNDKENRFSKNHDDYRSNIYRRWENLAGKRCPEWDDMQVFKNWLMEHDYKKYMVLLRKDAGKPYSPENCFLVTRSDFSSNYHRRGK